MVFAGFPYEEDEDYDFLGFLFFKLKTVKILTEMDGKPKVQTCVNVEDVF